MYFKFIASDFRIINDYFKKTKRNFIETPQLYIEKNNDQLNIKKKFTFSWIIVISFLIFTVVIGIPTIIEMLNQKDILSSLLVFLFIFIGSLSFILKYKDDKKQIKKYLLSQNFTTYVNIQQNNNQKV